MAGLDRRRVGWRRSVGVVAEIGPAEASGYWSAVVQATMGLARLGGLAVEKQYVQLDDQAVHLKLLKELSAVSQS